MWSEILGRREISAPISHDGFFQISSQTLNEISKPLGGPDARNLVKFDSSDQLPSPLKNMGLSILPISRGEFLVGKFKVYLATPDEDLRQSPIRSFADSGRFETLDTSDLNSESKALMAAYSTGIIADFLGDEAHHTGFGKTSAEQFSFTAPLVEHGRLPVNIVSGTPMEIDGVYETRKIIGLVEAKNKRQRDFHVRQLYYPFRSLALKHSKPLAPILMTQSGGVFEFRQVNFRDHLDISSFEISKFARYAITPDRLTIAELKNHCNEVKKRTLPDGETFPQADQFEKVFHVVTCLARNPMNKTQIAELFGYAPRQGDYYAKAGEYLGLVEKTGSYYRASKAGISLVQMSGVEQLRAISKLLLETPTIRDIFLETVKSRGRLPVRAALGFMRHNDDNVGLNATTERRRVNTALDWVDWILSNCDPL